MTPTAGGLPATGGAADTLTPGRVDTAAGAVARSPGVRPPAPGAGPADLLDRAARLLPDIVVGHVLKADVYTSLRVAASYLGGSDRECVYRLADEARSHLARYLVGTGQVPDEGSDAAAVRFWTLVTTADGAADGLRAAAGYAREHPPGGPHRFRESPPLPSRQRRAGADLGLPDCRGCPVAAAVRSAPAPARLVATSRVREAGPS